MSVVARQLGHPPTAIWIALTVLAAALLVWWSRLIGEGPAHVGAWTPFALPVLFLVRAFVRSRWAPGLLGFGLGVTLSGATGRGVVFVLLALAAVVVDAVAARGTPQRSSLSAAAGFGLGLLALWLTLSMKPPT